MARITKILSIRVPEGIKTITTSEVEELTGLDALNKEIITLDDEIAEKEARKALIQAKIDSINNQQVGDQEELPI